MIVIIAGSRSFNDYKLFKEKCNKILRNKFENLTIYSDGAKGADSMAIDYSKELNIPFIVFRANRDSYGKSAEMKRNREIALAAKDYEAGLIAFWDGKSPGTKNMIDTAKEFGFNIRIIKL